MALRVDKKSGKLKLLEADVEKACIELLQHYGWRCHRLHTELIHSKRGGRRMIGEAHQPDWIVARARPHCEWFYLEMKRPGGQPTDGQRAWHGQARHDGAVVIVADSVPSLLSQMTREFGVIRRT